MAPPNQRTGVAALLLTGGASRRMGTAKALIEVDGETLARRTARLVAAVADPVLEVGPGYSGAPAVRDTTPGAGPLAALADGVAALRAAHHAGPALLLATDLPRLDAATLRTLARWPGEASVVPVFDGRPQPLCARWSVEDLDAVAGLVRDGARALKPLLARPGIIWARTLDPLALTDADTPEELTAARGPSPPRLDSPEP